MAQLPRAAFGCMSFIASEATAARPFGEMNCSGRRPRCGPAGLVGPQVDYASDLGSDRASTWTRGHRPVTRRAVGLDWRKGHVPGGAIPQWLAEMAELACMVGRRLEHDYLCSRWGIKRSPRSAYCRPLPYRNRRPADRLAESDGCCPQRRSS